MLWTALHTGIAGGESSDARCLGGPILPIASEFHSATGMDLLLEQKMFTLKREMLVKQHLFSGRYVANEGQYKSLWYLYPPDTAVEEATATRLVMNWYKCFGLRFFSRVSFLDNNLTYSIFMKVDGANTITDIHRPWKQLAFTLINWYLLLDFFKCQGSTARKSRKKNSRSVSVTKNCSVSGVSECRRTMRKPALFLEIGAELLSRVVCFALFCSHLSQTKVFYSLLQSYAHLFVCGHGDLQFFSGGHFTKLPLTFWSPDAF